MIQALVSKQYMKTDATGTEYSLCSGAFKVDGESYITVNADLVNISGGGAKVRIDMEGSNDIENWEDVGTAFSTLTMQDAPEAYSAQTGGAVSQWVYYRLKFSASATSTTGRALFAASVAVQRA